MEPEADTPATPILPGWVRASPSLARAQRSLADPADRVPLWPLLLKGCADPAGGALRYPAELAFDYDAVPSGLGAAAPQDGGDPGGGDPWAPLRPPLAPGLGLGEGGPPLVAMPGLAAWAGLDLPVLIKDESRNPTWSHEDRYAQARAGLPCIVLVSPETAGPMLALLAAYGATIIAVPRERRWPVLRRIVAEFGLHPGSNLTAEPTGHPFGPEGYKAIAFEIFEALGRRAPGLVAVPTGYAELLFGIWKGFRELHALGLAGSLPRMVAVEPVAAQRAAAHQGLFLEHSAAAGIAALRRLAAADRAGAGPAIAVATSTGRKDEHRAVPVARTAGDWPAVAPLVAAALRRTG